MRNLYTVVLCIIIAIFSLTLKSVAQCDTIALAPDSLQYVFCQDASSGDVYAVEKYNDTLYVGGRFNFVGKYTGQFIGVDTVTGAVYNQPTWPKVNGDVYACIPDGSGGIIIGGNFTKVGNVYRECLAHINSSGQVTSLSYNFSGFPSEQVEALLLHNGILYVGGAFNGINGTTRNSIAAINISTAALTSWNPNVAGTVKALETDGTNIYVGGAYSAIGSTSYDNLAAVSISTGNVVTTWIPSISANTLGVKKILISGNIMYICGGLSTGINKIFIPTASGMTWNNYPNSTVNDILLAGNKLYVAGTFNNVGSQTRRGIAVLDTTNGSLLPWNPNITGGQVNAIALQGNKMFAVGNFTTVGGQQRNCIAAIDTVSGAPSNLQVKNNPGTTISRLLPVGDKVYLGGNFLTLDGVPRKCLAALDLHANQIHSFDHLVGNGNSTAYIYALKAENNTLYIGGAFRKMDSDTANSYCVLDLGTNQVVTTAPMLGHSLAAVRAIEIQSNHIYLGGNFSINHNGQHYGILRINKSNNTIDSWAPTMYSGGSSTIYDMAIAGNNIYLVGDYIYNPGLGNSMLMKTNLATAASAYLANGSVLDESRAVCVIGNKVYVGGEFSKIANVSRNSLAAFDTSNLAITSFNPLNPTSDPISSINHYKNRLIITCAQMSQGSPNPVNRKGVAVLDTSTGVMQNAWKPEILLYPQGTHITDDTAIVFGVVYDAADNNITGVVRFHFQGATPQITISFPDTICANTNTTFTVSTTVNGGTYQWKKNGSNVGTNSTSYSYTPVNGDIISCTVTIPNTTSNCYLATNQVVATDTVDVIANTAPTLFLTASDDTVCTGTRVYYSVTTNMPGANYQWKVGSTNVGTNSDTFSYIPSNGNVISCIATKATGTCFSPSSSSEDTMMVVISNAVPVVTVADTAGGSICPGSTDSFTATTNIAGATYQWKVNGSNAGQNDSTYSYIPSNSDQVYCIITMPPGCFTQAADTSNTITVIHQAPIVPNISISASGNPVCVGTPVNFTTTTNITGGTYKWQVGPNSVGGNNNTYSYTPANNDIVSCTIIAPDGCYIPDSAINDVTMTVTPKTKPAISITGPLGAGEFATVNLSATLTNAGSTYNIDWINNGNIFASTSTPAATYVKGKGTDNITAIITPVGCYDTASSNTLIIMEDVSVENTGTLSHIISVYPNPFDRRINITGLSKDDIVALYDVLSRQVKTIRITEVVNEYELELQDLIPGTYFLEVTSAEGIRKAITQLQKQ